MEEKEVSEDCQFWQSRTQQSFTEEEIQAMDSNLVEFFEILLDWHEEDLIEHQNQALKKVL